MKQIIINSEELQTRVAVVNDGVLQDFFMERTARNNLVGSIFKGKIKNMEPSLQAAFVDIGGSRNAFLHYWDMLPASRDTYESEALTDDVDLEEELPPAADILPEKRKGFLSRLRSLFGGNKKQEEAVRNAVIQLPQRRQGKKSRRPIQPPQPQSQYTVDDIPNLFKPGQEILVQVVKGPIGTKGPRVTTNLSIPGRYLVLLPNSRHIGVSKRVEDKQERDRLRRMMRSLSIPRNMGVICRTAGAGVSTEYFQRDLDLLVEEWQKGMTAKKRLPFCVYQEPALTERAVRDCLTADVDEVVTDSNLVYARAQEMMQKYSLQKSVKVKLYDKPTPIFNRYNLANQIDAIFSRKVPLPSGGYLCIDQTEALIAIDVNSGRNRSCKDQAETILTTNMEAVKEIARQVRLRNVGGIVVLDLIDMKSKDEQTQVYRSLKSLMADDRARTKVYPISPLGLIEMTRQREDESLESATFDDCPYCHGRGLIKSATTMSVEIQRRLNELLGRRHIRNLQVCVHPRILERLKNEDRKLFSAIEVENRVNITFKPENTLHIENFEIQNADTGDIL